MLASCPPALSIRTLSTSTMTAGPSLYIMASQYTRNTHSHDVWCMSVTYEYSKCPRQAQVQCMQRIDYVQHPCLRSTLLGGMLCLEGCCAVRQ